MKSQTHTTPHGAHRPHAAMSAVCMAAAILAPALAMAQDAGGADSTAPTAAVDVDSMAASRFVGGDALSAYLNEVAGKLQITGRQTDPFGQVQNPEAKPKLVKTPTLANRNTNSYRPTAFGDIVKRIEINTIMPSENRFLIGTRSFKLGDKFPIGYRGRNIEVEVVAISSNKIDFKQVETGEVASVKLSLLPAGMSSGSDGGLTAPGMVVDDKAAPLQLDNN